MLFVLAEAGAKALVSSEEDRTLFWLFTYHPKTEHPKQNTPSGAHITKMDLLNESQLDPVGIGTPPPPSLYMFCSSTSPCSRLFRHTHPHPKYD